MEKLEKYCHAIEQIILKYQQLGSSQTGDASQSLFDTEQDHCQPTNVGWHIDRHIYGCVLPFDIQGGKIGIQHNDTEFNIADELVELGVAKHNMVLGLQLPFERQSAEFAVFSSTVPTLL